jgi:cytochrome c5
MKSWIYFLLSILVLAASPALSQAGGNGLAPAHKAAQVRNDATHNAQRSDGERKFEQNCSRCHNAPESFSPRISGTIVRHMRVRASLSRQDEQDILRFLNP